MAHLNLGAFSFNAKYVGEAAKPDLFGANFLFNRDGSVLSGGIDENYKQFIQEAQVSTLRYPGGTLTETRLDLADPESTNANFVNPNSESTGPTVPLTSFLSLCKSMNAGATIVLPTYRFLSETPDATGHRSIDVTEETNLRTYIKFAIEQSISIGTRISAIEIGNEWYVDNSEIFGFQMSPVEYGRIANYMSVIIQSEIDSAKYTGALADVPEPAIVIQVGPGGEKELYKTSGFRVTEDYNGPTLTATEIIANQLTNVEAREAIDGVLMHRYMTVSDARAGAWVYSPFKTWDAVTSKISGFNSVDQFVTEWNVSSRNTNEHGLQQFDSMFEMIREMLLCGVDHANVWAVQQNNRTRMIGNTGADGAKYGGLTFGGLAFDIASTQLRGLKALTAPEEMAGISINAFGSADRSVLVLTNRTDLSATHTVDLAKILKSGHHTTIYRISEGPDGKPTVKVETLSVATRKLIHNLQFGAQESVVVVTSAKNSGATIEGYEMNDLLTGSRFKDVISGGGGDDQCRAGDGDDSVAGEEGADSLHGENGDDTLDGGPGNDLIYGGAGNDVIVWSLGNDSIYGGEGVDVLSFQGNDGELLLDLSKPQEIASMLAGSTLYGIEGFAGSSFNDIMIGASRDDVLHGGDGCDLIYGSDGNDRLLGQGDTDTVYGEAGNDLIDGGLGSDLLSGGLGNDTIDGNLGEDSIFGGEGDDYLRAGAGSDSVFGESGNDVIYGEDGADSLFGGEGGDTVLGGEGRDYLYGDAGNDYLSGGTEVDRAYGGGGSDSIEGGAGSDYLFGGSESDSVYGGTGDDIMHGDDGSDRLFGGNGADNVYGGSGDDFLFGGIGADVMRGDDGDDLIYGEAGNDHIVGGHGQDSLYGGQGNDSIVGGLDGDLLFGGSGADTFIFFGGVVDSTVMDFRNNVDTLLFSRQFSDGPMTPREFVDTYATYDQGSIIFDFGANGTLTVLGLKSVQQLYDDVSLVSVMF
jgi:Ca2+-binding RTX toxin-like protein